MDPRIIFDPLIIRQNKIQQKLKKLPPGTYLAIGEGLHPIKKLEAEIWADALHRLPKPFYGLIRDYANKPDFNQEDFKEWFKVCFSFTPDELSLIWTLGLELIKASLVHPADLEKLSSVDVMEGLFVICRENGFNSPLGEHLRESGRPASGNESNEVN